MKDLQPFYLRKIRDEFEIRMSRRKSYSLRSYARSLGIAAPSLLGVLKGTRRLPKNKVDAIAQKLNLSPNEHALFIESNKQNQSGDFGFKDIPRKKLDAEANFRIIAEWEHYAILSLIETKDFNADTKWISERLGITKLRAQICLENLTQANLIRSENGSFYLNQQGLATSDGIQSQALRNARKQDLELALSCIDDIGFEHRDFSSATLTLNLEDLQELKQMIRNFRRRFMRRAEVSKGNEVFKISIQLFPLTKIRGQNENK